MKPTGTTSATSPSRISMEKVVRLDKYNGYEEGHPGYPEMMKRVVFEVVNSVQLAVPPQKGKILEIGAGTGNLTRRLGNLGNVAIDANEYGDEAGAYLRHKIETGTIKNTALHIQDFFKFADEHATNRYDVVTTTFADHHFSPADKPAFLEHIAGLLKQGCAYINGDEFLPEHNEENPAERVAAQIKYHGMIIEKAFKEGKVELPKLELEALKSGLSATVSFIQQTVPHQRYNTFRKQGNTDNYYNAEGIEALKQLTDRLVDYTKTPLENPEKLSLATLYEEREKFITSLRELRRKLYASPQPGLDGRKAYCIDGIDYKMTLRQYTHYLKDAGFKALAYFEGPENADDFKAKLDDGSAHATSIELKEDGHYPGGVWVVKAIADKLSAAVMAKS